MSGVFAKQTVPVAVVKVRSSIIYNYNSTINLSPSETATLLDRIDRVIQVLQHDSVPTWPIGAIGYLGFLATANSCSCKMMIAVPFIFIRFLIGTL